MNTEHLTSMASGEISANAETVATALLHGGLVAGKASAILTSNYTKEFLGAVAKHYAQATGAQSSGDKALRNLGCTFRRAVPRNDDGEAECAPLTLKCKQHKTVAGGKALALRIEEAAPTKKNEPLTQALVDAMKAAYVVGPLDEPDAIESLAKYIGTLIDAGAPRDGKHQAQAQAICIELTKRFDELMAQA